MASAMVPGPARNKLRNVAMGLIFVSSLQQAGNALVRANTIPAVMPSMAPVVAAAAAVAPVTGLARVFTTNSIGMVPYEKLTRSAAIDKMSSFRPTAAYRPVFEEDNVEGLAIAKQMVLSEKLKKFSCFTFPEYPTLNIDVEIDVTPDPGSEYETASQRSDAPSELLAGMQLNLDFSTLDPMPGALSVADSSIASPSVAASSVAAPSIAASSANAPVSVFASSGISSSGTSSSSTQIRLHSIISGQQSHTEATSELPPSHQADNITVVSHTQPSLNAISRTSSRTFSATGSVTSRLSGPVARSNDLAGMNRFDSIAQELGAGGSRRDEDMLGITPGTAATAHHYADNISVSIDNSSGRSLALSPEPEMAGSLPHPLGARQKHATWHFNHQWPEPLGDKSMKRNAEQAELDSHLGTLGKRVRFGSPFASFNACA